MSLGPKLGGILSLEIQAGNSVVGEYVDEFADCKILVILKRPFHAPHVFSQGVEGFTNRDSHYPVGVGYKDVDRREILLAPFA